MSAVIDVAPQGDLVVAIGKGHARKVARISSSLIKFASPVFHAMLGPSFKEGQSIFNASNPLKLPDDDPSSTLNFFHILHYNADKANKTAKDWLQQLIVVCDKYQCASKLRDFILNQIWRRSGMTDVDRFIIGGLIGDKEMFGSYSSEAVRMTESSFKSQSHTELLKLVPKEIFGRTKDYRRKARIEYRHKYHDMLAKIFLSPLVDDRTLCYGLSQRVDSLNETLYRDEALTENYEKDSKLCDMHDILVSENDGIDKPRCSGICNGCLVKIQDIIKGVTVGFVLGTDRDMRVCFQCFQQREFNFSEECTTHNNRAE